MVRRDLRLHDPSSRFTFILKLVAVLLLWFILKRFPEAFELYGVPERLIEALLFFMTAWLIVSFARVSFIYIYIKKNKRTLDYKDNFILGINQIATITTSIFLVMSLFLLFDIAAQEFFTSISIFAVAIVLISKDYISNLINGMILMFADEISLNDYVKIGNHKGRITDITLSKIHMVSDDEELVLIPNTTVYNGEVLNYTKRLEARIIIDFDIDLKHVHSFEKLEEHLMNVLEEFSHHVKKDTAFLKILSIEKDLIKLKFQFVQARKNRELEKNIRKKLNRSIIAYITNGPQAIDTPPPPSDDKP